MAGAVGLLFTSMHMTLLGALLALAPRPLYGEASVSCLGLTLGPAADQSVGGTVMLAVGAVVYLAGGLALVARGLKPGRV
jgi:putative membrane protein